MKKVKCENCKYGGRNFWGYMECWLYNEELDFENTINAADREITAFKLNKYGHCSHFCWKSLFLKIKHIF